MKTIQLIIAGFILSLFTANAVPDDSFKPMQLSVPEWVSNNELNANIRDITAKSIESFIEENTDRKGARVAFFPCVTDVDSLATDQLAALLATKGKASGFKVTAPSSIRGKALSVMKQGLQQDGLVDPDSVKQIGKILQADVIVIPSLKLTPDENQLGVGIRFAAYDVETGIMLGGGGLVEPQLIKKKLPFMEEHGTKLYIGIAILILLIVIKTVMGVISKASRPR